MNEKYYTNIGSLFKKYISTNIDSPFKKYISIDFIVPCL